MAQSNVTDDINNQDDIASSPLAWVDLLDLVTENQRPIEFTQHRFMIDPMSDPCDDIIGRKSAQVGWSIMEIMRSFHEAKYEKRNIGYILPTKNVVDDFVKPKVNPLISSNPIVASMVTDDSISLKKVGDRFIYFKGAFSQAGAISFSIDTLVLDEYDRMPNMTVVNTFDSRLQAAKHPKRRRFSNPSQVGFGVDELYTDSDQRHWIITCDKCGYEWYMDWEPDGKCHYVDRERKIYACGKCKEEISDEARRMGRWVAKFPGHKRHGYWFSQMMAPWVTAERIIEQYEESSIEFFYNFVLGKAYTPTDMVIDRAAILRANAPSNISKMHVSIGVDQDAGGQYYVAMTPQGVFDYGYVDSWDKIEHLKLMYNAVVVCDPNPYPTYPKLMSQKYKDWYMCYFKNIQGLDTIEWKNSVVYADRTRVIDIVANEIVNAKLLFRQRPYELEKMIEHWNNIYRTTVEKPDGRVQTTWLKKDGKQSDYPFALCVEKHTLVMTDNGNKPIYKVKVGDNVLTRDGYKRVIASGQTGVKEVIRAEFTDGSHIIATPDHRIFTHNRGFIRLSELLSSDILDICQYKRNMSTFKVRNTLGGQIQIYDSIGSITHPQRNQNICYIKQYGNPVMVISQRAISSTIKTITHLITRLVTSFALVVQNISLIISVKDIKRLLKYKKKNGVRELSIHQKRLLNQQHGSIAKMVKSSSITQNSGVVYIKRKSLSVKDVVKNMSHRTTELIPGVLKPAHTGYTGKRTKISIWLKELVQFVTRHSPLVSGVKLKPAQQNVALSKLVYLKGRIPVYNLTVEGKPEYYANGILVHNCYARIGLAKVLGGGMDLITPYEESGTKVSPHVANDSGIVNTDFRDIMQETWDNIDD